MYRIVKVYNNNTVAATINDKTECILTGSGIGFSTKPGEVVPNGKVEKIYYIHNEMQTKFLKLLEDSTKECLAVSEEIVRRAEKELDVRLGTEALITLCDHLSFAIERQKQGVNLPNLLAEEVKLLYPEEYRIGVWGVKRIREKTGVELYLDEASYIAMHLVDASVQNKKGTSTQILQFVKDVINIIRSTYGMKPELDNENYIRLSTHLKYLARSILHREHAATDGFEEMLDFLMHKHPQNPKCVRRILDYIQKEFHYQLQDSETAYLLIYVNRMLFGKNIEL